MSQTRGMAYLRRKLELKRSRVLTRYKYYEMKNAVKDFGMVTPPEFRTFSEVLGWCGKAVDSLADRLIFREFRQDNFDLNSIYLQNNADILFDSAVLSALISSCSFLYICAGEDGFPRMSVLDGGNATGIIDDVTGKTLASASSLEKGFEGKGSDCEAAKKVGQAVAERAKAAGIETVVFDRGGYVYHGRVQALAEGAREGGLKL